MNIIESALSYVSSGLVQKASALVDESPASTRKALETAVPTIVAGLAGESATTGGATKLMRVIGDAGLVGPPATVSERLNASSAADLASLGKDLLARIFGGRMSGIADADANASGVRPSSMASLLGIAAPLVLGSLGSHVHTHGLDAQGLAGFLGAQRSAALRSLPASVLTTLSGVTTAVSGATAAWPAPSSRQEGSRVAAAGFRRLLPAALLLVPLAIILGLAFRRPSAPTTQQWNNRARLGAGLSPQAGPTPPAAAPPATTVDAELEQFLSSPGDRGSSKRFVFDHLNFEFATANLTPESIATLDRVVAVLKAHPNATVLVEGHTDAVGLPADNQHLSLLRANAVKSALVARGVPADHIDTAGIGQDRPIDSNDTEEGRARNRRTELVVTKP